MRKLIKRILPFALVVAMCLCMAMPAFAYADTEKVYFYGALHTPDTGVRGEYYYAKYSDTNYWVGYGYTNATKPVKMVQAYCFHEGHLTSLSDIDGVFGNNTYNAVKSFQNRRVTQDGVVGTDTWKWMACYLYGDMIADYLP